MTNQIFDKSAHSGVSVKQCGPLYLVARDTSWDIWPAKGPQPNGWSGRDCKNKKQAERAVVARAREIVSMWASELDGMAEALR